MDATLSAPEWRRLVAFHSLYDLPDGFLVAGQLGSLVSGALGGKARPCDFAPFYDAPPSEPTPEEARAQVHARFAAFRAAQERRKP